MNHVAIGHDVARTCDVSFVSVPFEFPQKQLPAFNIRAVVQQPYEVRTDCIDRSIDSDGAQSLAVDGPMYWLARLPTGIDVSSIKVLLLGRLSKLTTKIL